MITIDKLRALIKKRKKAYRGRNCIIYLGTDAYFALNGHMQWGNPAFGSNAPSIDGCAVIEVGSDPQYMQVHIAEI